MATLPTSSRAPGAVPPVSFTLRGIEPWVAWGVAGYTALLPFTGVSEPFTVWLFALFAVAVGKWADRMPAHRQSHLALRANVLLAGAFFLQWHLGNDPAAPIDSFYWVAATLAGYSFLLRRGWAWGLLASGLMVAVAARFTHGSTEGWPVFATQALALALFMPLLGMRFGAALRQVEAAARRKHIDPLSSLLNTNGLIEQGADAVAAARKNREQVVLAVFHCPAFVGPETPANLSRRRKALEVWSNSLRDLAGSRGLAARTGEADFAVLFTGTTCEKARKAIETELAGLPMRSWRTLGEARAPILKMETLGAAMPVAELHEALMEQIADKTNSTQTEKAEEAVPAAEANAEWDSMPPSFLTSFTTRWTPGAALAAPLMLDDSVADRAFAATDIMPETAGA